MQIINIQATSKEEAILKIIERYKDAPDGTTVQQILDQVIIENATVSECFQIHADIQRIVHNHRTLFEKDGEITRV